MRAVSRGNAVAPSRRHARGFRRNGVYEGLRELAGKVHLDNDDIVVARKSKR